MRFLSISPVTPFENLGHAGGKTYFEYISSLCEEGAPSIDAHVLAFCPGAELEKWKNERLVPYVDLVLTSGTLRANLKHLILDLVGNLTWYGTCDTSLYKLCESLRYLRKAEKQGILPDVIELEWTNFVLFAPAIKRRYPNIKIAASEHDVSFLGAQRRYEEAVGIKKHVMRYRYRCLKKRELKALDACDLVMPQNFKDKRLLVENGIDSKKIQPIVPYFHNMSHIVRENTNHDILFWGAMYREENYMAALWFIDEVMPLLADTDVRFVVAGNRPPEVLRKKQSERVIVTGFVEDETPLFANSLCFVSPLSRGAGIKVKVIEAMSAGIPVLTNQIGIEGIPGEDKKNYYHCENKETYETVIRVLLSDPNERVRMENEQRLMIEREFDLQRSICQYKENLLSLQG